MVSVLESLLPGLRAGRPLDGEEAGAAAAALVDPAATDAARAEFLAALADKGETAEELAAFARALLPRAVPVPFPDAAREILFDCCGTGGGGLALFNVSTALAFVLAAIGIPVAKHGNRGLTKPSGSIDVVEALGVRAAMTPLQARESLRDLGLAFLHAPSFHPAFAAVAAARKQLGRRTIFNLLGPLLNPCQPASQLIGVFDAGQVPLYAAALRLLDRPRFLVACGRVEGRPIGEVSPGGMEENVFAAQPALPGLEEAPWPKERPSLEELMVRDAAESAALVESLLRGDGGERLAWGRELLRWNGALACVVQGKAATVPAGLALVDQALREGAGWVKLVQARARCRLTPIVS